MSEASDFLNALSPEDQTWAAALVRVNLREEEEGRQRHETAQAIHTSYREQKPAFDCCATCTWWLSVSYGEWGEASCPRCQRLEIKPLGVCALYEKLEETP